MADKEKELTISQALRRRRKLKGLISTYTNRIEESLVYDEKKPPTFSYEESSKLMEQAKFELVSLEDAVAFANATHWIPFKGESVRLTWVIRALAEIKGDISRYERYKDHSYLLAERKTVQTDDVPDLSQVTETTAISGGILRKHPLKTVTKTTISSITSKECADKIQSLQDEFEALNDLLEAANHGTVVRYQDQLTEEAGGGTATQSP
jgi:hypothetical protein